MIGAGTIDGGATLFTSILLIIENDFARYLFKTSSLYLLRQLFLNIMESIDVHSESVNNTLSFLEGGTGGSEW
jgi:hypothetical protein